MLHTTVRSLLFFVPVALLCGPMADVRADYADFNYTVTSSCTTSGGGTWGSILKLCVEINNSTKNGKFRVYKKDGSAFTEKGDASILIGSVQGGEFVGLVNYNAGASSTSAISDYFPQHYFPNKKLSYYAELRSEGGGKSWVGPMVVTQKKVN